MIRGYCRGGGLLTALRADIRLAAAAGSQLAIPAARLGVGYGLGGVERLLALVGPAWTAEILFSARSLSADEALRIGLVNGVVAPDALDGEVRSLAGASQPTLPSLYGPARRPSPRPGAPLTSPPRPGRRT
jgi:enoyl-CoA hydratase